MREFNKDEQIEVNLDEVSDFDSVNLSDEEIEGLSPQKINLREDDY